ncbi:MAG: hypothetical protein H0U59_00915 [Gemmatimonadaceae bacterium]|nr:hypothetical protein [Gemmatimonadaceae bacterium]
MPSWILGLLILVFIIACFTVIPYGVQILIVGFIALALFWWVRGKMGSGAP